MLVAYGPDGHPIVAEESSLEELQRWSHERVLYCPNCRGVVHVRGGPEKRTQLHFAHQKGECAWGTETESVRHARGKMVLAEWLREQFPQARVTLEERLPEPNRIADVFVRHADGRQWAIEFQCAPLDVEKWRHRHSAYRKANILDIWIIGNNRCEKQEVFIEAIIAMACEVMFLNPLVTPSLVEMRWVVDREMVEEWQREISQTPSSGSWVGRLGLGASLRGPIQDVRLGNGGKFLHVARLKLETRMRLLDAMKVARVPDEGMLAAYLDAVVSEETIGGVIRPLVRAYLRDPDLLRRYNYGRGLPGQPVSEADRRRVQQAHRWLSKLAEQGFAVGELQELAKEIPFVGPYGAFANYIEMLVALC